MFCIVVMENFGCADFVSNPGAEYSIYGLAIAKVFIHYLMMFQSLLAELQYRCSSYIVAL